MTDRSFYFMVDWPSRVDFRLQIFQWIMPSSEGCLEAEGLEKTWRIKQEAIISEVDILSSRKAYDISLRGGILALVALFFLV